MSYYRSRSSSGDQAVYVWFAVVSIAWWLLTALFHAYNPFRAYLYWWNVNPLNMIALNMMFFGLGIALLKGVASDTGDGEFNFFDGLMAFVGIIGVFVWIWNAASYEPRVMRSIRLNTVYDLKEAPPEITDFRVSSYAEAQTNFGTQNPDARFMIGKMSYIHDRWIAEYGPKGFLNSWNHPTQGFYLYDPRINKNPIPVTNPMRYAENGIAGNSLRVAIASRDPFAYYEKVLYTLDPDFPERYMGVVSLVKRRGMDATPYVSNVVVVHMDGRLEWLTPEQGVADPRLEGLQLIPEWLEGMTAAAYNYPLEITDAWWYHTGQKQVQVSSTNEENRPPFHMRSSSEMLWVTPLSPYNTPSFVALTWRNSKKIGGPMNVWVVPSGQALPGVDALSATIKNPKNGGHPADIDWLINNAGTLSGQTEILELLPIGHKGELYFVGYAASGNNPQETRMFVTIRAADSTIMQDMFSIDEVNSWLHGETELAPLTPAETASPSPLPSDQLDLKGYTTEQLWQLLDQVINEIQKRGDGGGTMVSPLGGIDYSSDSELYRFAWRIFWEIVSR